MIEGILLTDMALHGKVFASAKDLVARNAAAIAHAQHSAAAAAAAVPDALSAALHSSTNNNSTATVSTATATESSVRSSSDVTLDVSGDEAAAALTLSPEDERAMLACLLHAADLSSPGRPWTVSKQWVGRLWEVCAVLLFAQCTVLL
jgi:3'5'-cyclic nucleotide phosphodiesterase